MLVSLATFYVGLITATGAGALVRAEEMMRFDPMFVLPDPYPPIKALMKFGRFQKSLWWGHMPPLIKFLSSASTGSSIRQKVPPSADFNGFVTVEANDSKTVLKLCS